MNPLTRDLAAFLAQGKQLTELYPCTWEVDHGKVVFTFADGSKEEKAYQCDSRTFLAWCKRTAAALRDALKAFEDVPVKEP